MQDLFNLSYIIRISIIMFMNNGRNIIKQTKLILCVSQRDGYKLKNLLFQTSPPLKIKFPLESFI